MIDVNAPMELDDGTPVTFEDIVVDSRVRVRLPFGKDWRRNPREETMGGGAWLYSLDTGIWSGGTEKEAFTLRNVADNSATVCEDWS